MSSIIGCSIFNNPGQGGKKKTWMLNELLLALNTIWNTGNDGISVTEMYTTLLSYVY